MTATDANPAPREPLLSVDRLKCEFPIRKDWLGRTQATIKAVDDVSFELFPGETLAVVGESGCGKSTLSRLILRLYTPTAGSIHFGGSDIAALKGPQLQAFRRNIQLIFQDPYSSLNPRMTVGQTLAEPLALHKLKTPANRAARIGELLHLVGLSPDHANRYPHEFSGGQRQRIGIARALAVEPKLIVCDEPISALDVSIQAQIINLLRELQHRFRLSYMFIAHDLSVVNHIADRVAVMYLGRIVELADKKALFSGPRHPYTQALLSAVPIPDPARGKKRMILHDDVPSPVNIPSGCRFHTRCPFATERCAREEPPLAGNGHLAACHYADEVAAKFRPQSMHVSPGSKRLLLEQKMGEIAAAR